MHSPLFHDDYSVALCKVIKVIGRQNSCLSSHSVEKHLFKDSVSCHFIDCTKYIIEQYYIWLAVQGSSQAYSGPLPTRQLDAMFANLGKVTLWKLKKILLKLASHAHFDVASLLEL